MKYRQYNKNDSPRRQAFTLIELLTVVAIILILMGLTIASMFFARQRAMISRTRADLLQIQNSVEEFKMARGYYPTALTEVTDRLPQNLSVDRDPWARPYMYTKDSDLSYSLYSKGPDPLLPADDILPRD